MCVKNFCIQNRKNRKKCRILLSPPRAAPGSSPPSPWLPDLETGCSLPGARTIVVAASCMDLQRGAHRPGECRRLVQISRGSSPPGSAPSSACCRDHAAVGRLPGLAKSGRGGTMERKMGWIGGALLRQGDDKAGAWGLLGNRPPRRERPVAHKLNAALCRLCLPK
jgi:hypothetical protein